MLEQIEHCIRDHAAEWRIDLPADARIHALLRANPEHDGIVREIAAGHTGTVFFWFRPGERRAFLVSKTIGPRIPDAAIADCTRLQESANRDLGYPLFPRILAVISAGAERVLLMEAADGPNYEIQLARAVCGPERSIRAFNRVVEQQFRELGGALRGLRTVALSATPERWGAQASSHARRFLELCPAARTVLDDARVAEMAALIDGLPMPRHFVLTEDHLANYLPGPRAVDQLVPDIHALCAGWPGSIGGLRILIGYFRASPIREAFDDYSWLDALALCIAHPDRVEALGRPVRRFLEDIGLESATPAAAWALVMGVFFMRACQELEFHAENVISGQLRGEFLEFAGDAVRISDALKGNDARLRAPRLRHQHLEGEFFNRDQAGFHSFPQTTAPQPRWIVAATRLQTKLMERYPWLYRMLRWAYQLIFSVIDRFRRRSRR